MEKIELFFDSLANFLWGDWLLVALLGLGAYYTVMTGGIQIRCVQLLRKGLFRFSRDKSGVKGEKKCSSYQALCAAIASCVGSGNIVGVSTAILSGGPGTLIQSNTIANVAGEAFHAPFLATGLIMAVVMSLIIRGGFKRLVQVAQRVVPVMAGIYVIGGLIVLLMNAGQIPAMFASIFREAFSIRAGTGALAGITIREAMRFGVARGLYSNEAGEGSAAVLHSAAEVDHPVRQGLYGVIEVFVDTIIISSTTGFTVLITGANGFHENASTLAAAAFQSVLPGMQ